MNGPQHYLMAEKLLKGAREDRSLDAEYLVALAHVHATLALAAATGTGGRFADDTAEWRKVTS